MLYVAYSPPRPNPTVEARVREQLKLHDELLDIRWIDNVYWNEKQRSFEGRYALICRWPQADKRWEMYQRGEIGDPYDIFGWFCEDIHNADSVPVDPESIERKIIELLNSADNNRADLKTRMKQAVEKNAAQRRANREQLSQLALDEVEYNYQKLRKLPIVAVSKDITNG